MDTTVYLIRHSIPFKKHRGIINTNETILIENQKSPLSIKGENKTRKFSKIGMLEEIISEYFSEEE